MTISSTWSRYETSRDVITCHVPLVWRRHASSGIAMTTSALKGPDEGVSRRINGTIAFNIKRFIVIQGTYRSTSLRFSCTI